ncbi:tetratricopeptide repeat-containing sensor histidine kinase [Mucilaginibacter aquatilis]|nr:HAMP domain-containing sensor histidine kinase [Mucilaginibacter aquatilis]
MSCKEHVSSPDIDIDKQLRLTDSLITMSKGDSGLRNLKKIRPLIKDSDPAVTDYYCFLAQWEIDFELRNRYADSAMAFFSTDARKKQHPNQYYKALLCKGEASVNLKQYNTALKYYYKAKQILNNGNCDDGYLSVKMANIYYKQKNFRQAARLWSNSYKLIMQCGSRYSFQKQFYTLQGVLNNTGISYQKSQILDSAEYFYLKDLKLIDTARSTGIDVNAASIVVFDNLGGLYLSKNDFKQAELYLLKAVQLPLKEVDGIKIPPYLKLADLYTRKKQFDRAAAAFEQSKTRLEKYDKQNLDIEVGWNKMYAQFLFAKGDKDEAYGYQNTYMHLKDSLESVSANLYKLDVNRELNSLAQQQTVNKLSQKNKLKKIFLAGSVVIALLSIVIIVLINRSLKRSQKANKEAALQNEKLEHALTELERVNQNYIRIMRVMAHDLRNPLSGMTGLAAILLGEDEFSEESRHMLHLIETTGIHTMEMINELLKSGLSDENEELKVELIDIKNLLFDSVELLQFKADEKLQKIKFTSDEESVMAYINHEKIWRVFNNLIVNAIKFSHEKTSIKVAITKKDNKVIISIADKGIGVPAKDQESIFEMFTPAKRVGTGGEQPFGLGLSISKRIIDMHKGKIWLTSTTGEGTTFYVELPTAD